MAKSVLDSPDVKIDQKPDIIEGHEHEPRIIPAGEKVMTHAHLEALKFSEDPVTIRISPSAEKNAPRSYLSSVNGKGAEVWVNGHWIEFNQGYLPVGRTITVKRKYVEVLLRAKADSVETVHSNPGAEVIENRLRTSTSQVAAISILKDDNPRGAAWAEALIRQQF